MTRYYDDRTLPTKHMRSCRLTSSWAQFRFQQHTISMLSSLGSEGLFRFRCVKSSTQSAKFIFEAKPGAIKLLGMDSNSYGFEGPNCKPNHCRRIDLPPRHITCNHCIPLTDSSKFQWHWPTRDFTRGTPDWLPQLWLLTAHDSAHMDKTCAPPWIPILLKV